VPRGTISTSANRPPREWVNCIRSSRREAESCTAMRCCCVVAVAAVLLVWFLWVLQAASASPASSINCGFMMVFVNDVIEWYKKGDRRGGLLSLGAMIVAAMLLRPVGFGRGPVARPRFVACPHAHEILRARRKRSNDVEVTL